MEHNLPPAVSTRSGCKSHRAAIDVTTGTAEPHFTQADNSIEQLPHMFCPALCSARTTENLVRGVITLPLL
jgi:hypothetical protein